MKSIDELKKSVFLSIPNVESESFRNLMDGLDTHERFSLLEFLLDPSDLNYAIYVLNKLNEEQTRLINANIPIEQWPPQLQDPSWDIEVFYSLMPEDMPYRDTELGGWKHALIPDSSKRIANLWRVKTGGRS